MSYITTESKKLFDEAKDLMPGGVNSPVRAFGGVGGTPIFMKKAEGAYLTDEDNQKYIDYIQSWGPMILGHAHPEVLSAVKEACDLGFSFGTPTRLESELAKSVMDMLPNMEMVRFVSSGTEACMSALRLARGYTGRDKIIKFNGCYHGHADMLLVQAGSGVATFGIPGSPGVPKGATESTLVAPYNDLEAVKQLFADNKDEIAAVILEPIAGNANFIRGTDEFLQGLRKLCDENKAVLIFDEVMTGFRAAKDCVQGLTKVKPDLTTLGKVVGGGMPIGAYGGRKEIMEQIAPSGPVYQAGTLSGNPVAVTCGLKTLDILKKSDYTKLSNMSEKLMKGFAEAAKEYSIDFTYDFEGGMFGFAFSKEKLNNFDDAKNADVEMFKAFFQGMLKRGIYLAPSAFEAGFVSFAHTDADIENTIKAARETMAELKS